MSMFDKHTVGAYMAVMSKFLGLNEKFVPNKGGINLEGGSDIVFGDSVEARISQLEKLVNEKASRVDASDSTFGERLRLARDYALMSDADIAREVGVSIQMVNGWGLNQNIPSDLSKLSTTLKVPLSWLENGNLETLSADSHLGVGVGYSAASFRGHLYAATQSIEEMKDELLADEAVVQEYYEKMVFEKPLLMTLARKAGGRWQVKKGRYLFVPWIPIESFEMANRLWSDEVEEIIKEELSVNGRSIQRAWTIICERCVSLGLSDDDIPTRITLYQRVEKTEQSAENFGLHMFQIISEPIAKNSKRVFHKK